MNPSSPPSVLLPPIFWGFFFSALLVGYPFWRISPSTKEDRFDPSILLAAGEFGCDPSLVKAVAWRESKFDAELRGKDGEYGLMQIMPSTGKEWAEAQEYNGFLPEHLTDPLTNLRAGSWYLARALQQWSRATEPIPLALAQYNAGRSKVLKWIDAPSLSDPDHFINQVAFPTTKTYIKTILKQYATYKRHGEF